LYNESYKTLKKINIVLELVTEKNNLTTLIDYSNNLIPQFESHTLKEFLIEHNLTESGKHAYYYFLF
jgi:hypothetical protein